MRTAAQRRARSNRAEDARITGRLLAIHPELAPHVAATGRLIVTTKVQQVQELRRSNAAQPHRNKSRYSRKIKHRKDARND